MLYVSSPSFSCGWYLHIWPCFSYGLYLQFLSLKNGRGKMVSPKRRIWGVDHFDPPTFLSSRLSNRPKEPSMTSDNRPICEVLGEGQLGELAGSSKNFAALSPGDAALFVSNYISYYFYFTTLPFHRSINCRWTHVVVKGTDDLEIIVEIM